MKNKQLFALIQGWFHLVRPKVHLETPDRTVRYAAFPNTFLTCNNLSQMWEPDVECWYLKIVLLEPSLHLCQLVASAASHRMESHSLASTDRDLPLLICSEGVPCWLRLMPPGLL